MLNKITITEEMIEENDGEITCAESGELLELGTECFYDDDNDCYYSEDCVFYCGYCCKWYPNSEGAYVDGYGTMCDECIEEHFVRCDVCEGLVERNSAHYNDDGDVICDSCYGSEAAFCYDCGRMIIFDNDYYTTRRGRYYCDYCHDSVIREYHDSPDYEYLGGDGHINDGYIRYGVELEIDKGNEADEAAEIIERKADYDVFTMEDGSLSDGFEIISMPATLEYHLDELGWYDIIHTARSYGFLSHDADTCGLHVHIGLDSFNSKQSKETFVDKLCILVDGTWDDMLKFSRRKPGQVDRWTKKLNLDISHTDSNEVINEKLLNNKSIGDSDRYRAVNTTNMNNRWSDKNTVEIRLYRGTLNLNTFYATLIFTDCLVQYAIKHTMSDCIHATFEEICSMCDPDKEHILDKYLKERGIR